ncbi:hypothetical protein JMJ35_000445 [Cladonia borealis]|uniref:FHA domain-containing protein n=1 Tax=Cladonia borealis TaxID=184061 RepID=A0AA39VA27_9LECA|nr:hypothetical protein JMJ35_000445 [Cladonia borealis]
MPEHLSDQDRRRERRQRYSSGSDEDELRRHRHSRKRNSENRRSTFRDDERLRDDSRSRSEYRKRHRSRSPGDVRSRARRRQFSDSESPDPRARSHRDHDGRKRSISDSSPPKRTRPRSRDGHRSSDHHKPPPASPTNKPPTKRSSAPLPSQKEAYNKEPTSDAVIKAPPEVEKQKPNFAPTGKLAAETNTVENTTIVLKYNEPPEARLPPPSSSWRLFVFKGSELLETLPLFERSCWLFGRERAVVDFPTEHPSCSKQHAVLQFRYTEKKNEWGEKKGAVKPYLIDLESANGTKVNGETLPQSRYVGLVTGDVITFGDSSREYVLMLPPKEEKKP